MQYSMCAQESRHVLQVICEENERRLAWRLKQCGDTRRQVGCACVANMWARPTYQLDNSSLDCPYTCNNLTDRCNVEWFLDDWDLEIVEEGKALMILRQF